MKISHVRVALACLTALFLGGTTIAMATFPSVVASSQVRIATGMTDPTKVVIDPSGNLYTVSGNGNLWEIPAGSATATQILLPNNATLNAGGAVKVVAISNTGSGYTTAPTVTFSAPASGATATGTANLSNGVVTSITITNAGTGYTIAAPPTITLSAPPAGGIQATAYANVTSYYGLGGPHGLAVDSSGDVIVQASYNYHIFFLQNKGGTLCVTCNSAGTGPLDLNGSYGFSSLTDYFGATSDVAVDQNGLVYIAMYSCNSTGANACGVSHNSILTVKTAGPSTTQTTINAPGTSQVFIATLPTGIGLPTGTYGAYAQNMALDTNGHIFYADGAHAWMASTTSPAPVTIGTFVSPYGVAVDAAGNLYVSDSGPKLLYCIPNEGGMLNSAHQFIVASATNLEYGVAFDAAGNFYSGDGYSSGSINKTTLGALSLGSNAVGTASANGTVTFWFNSPVTPSAISLVQGPGSATEFKVSSATCTAATTYPTSAAPPVQSCTETISLTPASTGIRTGAVELLSATNTALATAYLTGIGTGAALTADPGTQATPSALTAWKSPSAVALDALGNSYVADSGANAVQVISAAGTATATLGTGLGSLNPSSLSNPQGVAVDGAGNVYIADTGNSRVVMVPNVGGTLTPANAVLIQAASTLLMNAPEGVAVDSFGAIYVADTGNKRVLRFSTFDGLNSLVQSTLGSGFVAPASVTTDNNNNVYIADDDPSTEEVFLVNLLTSSKAPSVVMNNLNSPTSISIDASGSFYVVESGAKSVTRYPNVGGTINQNTPLLLAINLTNPTGVAVNGAGNVAISDAGAPGEFLLNRTASTLSFGSIHPGLTSETLTETLTSAGTLPVTLGAIPYVATGNGLADYNVNSPGSGGCTGGEVLSLGAICTFNAVLAPPTALGPVSETLTFSSNAANAGSITALLTGVAVGLAQSTTTLSVASGGNPVYGQTFSVLATVVPTPPAPSSGPTGRVVFTLNGAPVDGGYDLLSSSSPSTATLLIPALKLQAGTDTVNAYYVGDANFDESTATAPLLVTVGKQATTTAVSVSAAPDATGTQLTLLPGSTFYFNVTVSHVFNGSPTGTVYLVPAGQGIGSAVTQATLVSGSVQLAYAPTGGSGTYSYQVIYGGDTNFLSSTGTAAAVTLSPQNYTVSIPATTYTVTAGQSVTVPVTVTGVSGYNESVTVGALNLSNNVSTPGCTGLPANTTCIFSPGIVSLVTPNTPGILDANGNVRPYPYNNPVYVLNITLQTSLAPATPYPIPSGFLLWPGGLAGLLALTAATRRRGSLARTRLIALAFGAALSGAMLGMSGCGTPLTNLYPTPASTSNVTLTFSGSPVGASTTSNPSDPTNPITGAPIAPNNIIESLNFQLNVQPKPQQ